MVQQGQVFELESRRPDGERLWAYRYRTGRRESRRVQVGGFGSEQDARAALQRALEKLRRASRIGRRLTLAELVDEYLAQHEVSPVTLEKLRFLLTRAVQAFGGGCLDELNPVEIAAWRMTVPPGYRSGRHWYPAVPPYLRSQAHVRDLRPSCRHLHLRAL